MFETAIAGSLPKPSWLSETEKLWPQWKLAGPELQQAKADATLLWIKEQEDAGLDIVGDGEQSRQHFVHGFLEQVEGIDFEHKVKMGIRNNLYLIFPRLQYHAFLIFFSDLQNFDTGIGWCRFNGKMKIKILLFGNPGIDLGCR